MMDILFVRGIPIVVQGLVKVSEKIRDATTLYAKKKKMEKNPEDLPIDVMVTIDGEEKSRHVILLKSETEALLASLEKDFSSTRTLDQIARIQKAVQNAKRRN